MLSKSGFLKMLLLLTLFAISMGCSKNDSPKTIEQNSEPFVEAEFDFQYLALGDSYTSGWGVQNDRLHFPEQLTEKLKENLNKTIDLDVIAERLWRTNNLINAIGINDPRNDYAFVTLLIGVNNQFQGESFDIFKEEFQELLNMSISFAGDDPKRVIVISIPDYAFTPYGQNADPSMISEEIDSYNVFVEAAAKENKVNFISISDIAKNGLEDKELIAADGLHFSGKAYEKIADRIYPIALSLLKE